MQLLAYSEVRKEFPKAWRAVPIPYREDSCLIFYRIGHTLWVINDLGTALREGHRWNRVIQYWERRSVILSFVKELPSYQERARLSIT